MSPPRDAAHAHPGPPASPPRIEPSPGPAVPGPVLAPGATGPEPGEQARRRARIGWYAHHHGRGHVARATQVAAHLAGESTLLTSAPVGVDSWPGPVRPLPLDVGENAIELPACRALHWAPGHVDDLRRRTRDLVDWFVTGRPDLLVVDVSVEVALLARLSGVPVAWVRQHGDRHDPAHLGAYEAASLVLSPWPDWFDDELVPSFLGDRLVHVGGFSRFEGRPRDREAARRARGWDPDERHVVVLLGGGGHDLDGARLAAAVAASPSWRWHVLGRVPGARPDDQGADVGWVADPFPWLVAADLVVTTAGHNAVMDVAAAGTPTVVVPQARPWGEQVHKARLLDRHGLAHAWPTWPGADRVAACLDAAVAAPRHPAPLLVDGAAARAARVLDDLALDLVGAR